MKQYPLSLASLVVLAWSCGGGIDAPNPGNGPDPNEGNAVGDGDGDGAGDGDGDGDGPLGGEDGICEEFGVFAQPTIPEMLIVLDRSASMGRGVDRWTPSVNAVKSLSSQFAESVRFGLMVFPGEPRQECVFEDDPDTCVACQPGELNVSIDLNTANDIATVLNGMSPDGGTPTGETLEKALSVLGPVNSGAPDSVPTPKFVLLVTDGQPTCPSGGGTVQASADELAEDYLRTTAAIDRLTQAGVLTYVIGYDETLDPTLAAALTDFAKHGGTKDYRPVQNEADLLAEFDRISEEVVSCTYVLEEEPQKPSFVEVTLDGEQLALDDENGWRIDSKTLTLQGEACEQLQDGGKHALSVKVRCEEVVVIVK